MANYQDYMLFDKLPHTWCAGCGHGIILQAIAGALAQQELAGAARLEEAAAPGQDDLMSILVAWDLAL